MADNQQTVDRATVAKGAVAAALASAIQPTGFGNGRRIDSRALIDCFLSVAREVGRLRVGRRADGKALTLTAGKEPPVDVELPNVTNILRPLCAAFAVQGVERGAGEVTNTYTRDGLPRVERGPDVSPPLFGGRCFIRAGDAARPGWAVELMNTPGDHWFDLTWCDDPAAER